MSTPSNGAAERTKNAAGAAEEWTVLVYMGAVQNQQLVPDEALLASLQGAAEGTGATMVYQLATADGTEAGVVRGHGTPPEILRRDPPIDITSPRHLTAFLDWAQERFPSRYTALILKDHGSGWEPKGIPSPTSQSRKQYAMFWDGESNTWMSMPDAASAVRRSRRGSVDIYAFDACFMAMVEVAYEIRKVASFMVGSQPKEDPKGWPYLQLLDALRICKPAPGPRELARRMVQMGASEKFSLTAVELSRVGELAKAIDALASKVYPKVESIADIEASFQADGESVDLRWLLGSMEGSGAGKAAGAELEAVRRALDAACYETGGAAQGLSIFFPQSGSNQISSYGSIAFGRRNHWAVLLGEVNRVMVQRYRRSTRHGRAPGPAPKASHSAPA